LSQSTRANQESPEGVEPTIYVIAPYTAHARRGSWWSHVTYCICKRA